MEVKRSELGFASDEDLFMSMSKALLENLEKGPVEAPAETANSAMKKAVATAVKTRAAMNAAKFPKNNFFCFRWRVVDEFNKQLDRDLHNMRVYGGDYNQSLVNEKVLSNYKTNKLKFNQDFMKRITADAVEFLSTRRKKISEATQLDTTFTKSMSNVLQGMFDILISCSIEFNTTIGFSELFIASTEPEMVTFTTPNSKTTSLRARFSTTQFSLLMHGFKDEIKFCIVPVEELIGMSSFAYGRSAFIELSARIEEEGVVWYNGEEMLSEDVAERLCLEAMQRLVEQTCEVLGRTTPQ